MNSPEPPEPAPRDVRRRRNVMIGIGVVVALVVVLAVAASVGDDAEEAEIGRATSTSRAESTADGTSPRRSSSTASSRPATPSTSSGSTSTPSGSTPTTSGPPTSAPPTPTSPPPPPTAGGGRLTEQEARRSAEIALRNFLRTADAIYQAGGRDADPIAALATEPALGQVQGRAAELESGEQSQRGAVTVVRVGTGSVDVAAAPPTVVLRACLDDSDVRTVDQNGEPIQPSTGQTRRILHLYEVRLRNGAWLVARDEFPPGPSAC